MRDPDDNETWPIETGHDVMEKKAATGSASHIHRLWGVDCATRNAGDLETAGDLYAPFQNEGMALAVELSLPAEAAAFSLAQRLAASILRTARGPLR